MKSKLTYNTYDIKATVTEAVVEGHLRLSYSAETAYLDALVAAAWNHVEDYIGVRHGGGALAFESDKPLCKFTLPLTSEDVSAVTVQYWDGTTYNTVNSSLVYTSELGYPLYVKVDEDSTALSDYDTEDAWVITKGTATLDASTPEAALQQAFLLYLGFLYENRESVITGTIATPMPAGFQALLFPYKKVSL